MEKIRKGNISDLENLQQLFVSTVSEICKTDYNIEQISAWTSSIENNQRWRDIITNQYVLVAERKDKIVGFATLDNGNYLDMLYIDKDFQRQGIAYKLYTEIEREAKRCLKKELSSDVSKTARPFFEKVGFQVKSEQNVNVKNVVMTNFKMIKGLQ